MKSHMIGKPTGSDASAAHQGTSLAVAQWMELVRGERAVCRPRNLFRVEKVVAEERYCLLCCDVRCFDVVYGSKRSAISFQRCRCCGKEGEG